ncbi:MAG: CotH kinase family protein [Prevotellaceae bacterium]|jgi:hypothetical protein|nr:CotH kinase family protein [Prevotellaceae bacterium]
MKNILTLSIVLIFSILSINAQTSAKLNGTLIGTPQGYNYSTADDPQAANGNVSANAFDGNFNTFFAYAQEKGGWVGLDLGSAHVITSVKYCPRQKTPDRVECAVIEGANSPDFMDAVAIGIISSPAPTNQWSVLNINSSRGFRYVRYYGSEQYRCCIAELEFWGYAGAGNNSHIGQLTNLPTVNIHTLNNAVIDSKTVYRTGYITVVNEDTVKEDGLSIRGRGNASWGFDKKPYRIKFDNSTYLLGNPAKAKNWTLISNEGDKTLIRNLLAFDLSKRLEMPYTPAGRLVDVVINGDYKGCYQLCDHIDVRAGRVNVPEMTAADNSGIALTGGYLIEIDAYFEGGNTGFTSGRGVPVTVKSPDDDIRTTEQTNYIKGQFNAWEQAIMNNGDFRQYMDIESFVRHFIVGEFAGNTDTYWSVYMFKKRNDDKFYFSPIWDYDLAYENDQRTEPIMNRTSQNNNKWLYQWGGNDAPNVDPLIDKLLTDNDLYQRMREVWAQYRNSGAISEAALVQVIDNYVTEINTSQDLNFKRWDYLFQWRHMMWGRGDYTNNINIVKEYIRARLAWFDTKLNYVPSAINETELNSINIFSNNNELIISNLLEQTNIICFDITGRKIFEANAETSFSKQLPQGVYIVQLFAKNNFVRTEKIVIK